MKNNENKNIELSEEFFEETKIEGRNPVLEAFRSGKTVDKLFVLDGCQDGPVKSITREARKQDTIIHYVSKERLDQMSETHTHQGVIAICAAYKYAEVEDILEAARQKGEAPFIFLLDGITDPHNLWCDYPYSKPCRCTRRDYSEKQSCRSDSNSGTYKCRCD